MVGSPLMGQDEATVEVLARVLQAEDSRRFDGPLFREAANDGDLYVRRHVALTIGRVGNPDGIAVLLELLTDPDTVVQKNAVFSLGLIGSVRAFDRLRELVLSTPPDSQYGVHAEAMTAIARIGGAETVEFYRDLLGRWSGNFERSLPTSVTGALWQAWRLGENMPTELVSEFVSSPRTEIRRAATYSLFRSRRPGGARALLQASGDRDHFTRATAVRALTAELADSSGLGRDALADRVSSLLRDQEAHVRINALRAAATYASGSLTDEVLELLEDFDRGVRVQALITLGLMGGEEAIPELKKKATENDFAEASQALLALSRVAGEGALDYLTAWARASRWPIRRVAAQGAANLDGVPGWRLIERLLGDSMPQVAAAAVLALEESWPESLSVRAVGLLRHEDPVVRSVAAGRIAEEPDLAVLDELVEAYRVSLQDDISDARMSVVRALGAISGLGEQARVAVSRRFLERFPRAGDYLVRRVAREDFPEAASFWGPERPIETGRGLGDYREMARTFVLPGQGVRRPELTIETDAGDMVVTLYGDVAPITVHELLNLVERRYFDGLSWHRVVPNFVIQGGDPRGDGWGGPGFSLRDEVSPLPYERGIVGMALSGPDTGGSQLFITHSAQPHLEGIYPVLGRVEFQAGAARPTHPLDRLAQRDRIRHIRRTK